MRLAPTGPEGPPSSQPRGILRQSRFCSRSRKILASLVPPIVRHGGLRSPLAEAYAADQLLRARDKPRGHTERTEAESEKFRHRLLTPCQLAAQRDRHAWRVGDGDRQQP